MISKLFGLIFAILICGEVNGMFGRELNVNRKPLDNSALSAAMFNELSRRWRGSEDGEQTSIVNGHDMYFNG